MNRIKECRLKCNMSQKFVAMSLDIAAPSVSNWESGKTQPSLDNLTRLSHLFGVSIDYLLGKDEPALDPEIKNQPAALGSEPDVDFISMEESDRLFDSLVKAGLIHDDISFSADDRAFLTHVIGLLEFWIGSKRM